MPMIDELERLAALRDKGAVTEAEYEQAKARVLAPAPDSFSEPMRAVRTRSRLVRRSVTDRWIGGVCGGLARLTESEAWVWRLLFTAGLIFGGVTAFIYVLLWVFVPSEELPTTV